MMLKFISYTVSPSISVGAHATMPVGAFYGQDSRAPISHDTMSFSQYLNDSRASNQVNP